MGTLCSKMASICIPTRGKGGKNNQNKCGKLSKASESNLEKQKDLPVF